ncbi:MAG: ROK family protein, partial [Actinomycetota bacterium]|nr:ROK family protein [Actinomycetota bacterium]
AGEFGHMQVVPATDTGSRPCECGRMGCWEQYCSGKALGRYAEAAGSSLRGPDLTRAAEDKDPVARGAYAEVGRWLGIGIANVVAGIDPEMVIVGGGVSSAGELLLTPARRALRGSLVGQGHRRDPRLVAAELGPLAGLIGAALLSREMETGHR